MLLHSTLTKIIVEHPEEGRRKTNEINEWKAKCAEWDAGEVTKKVQEKQQKQQEQNAKEEQKQASKIEYEKCKFSTSTFKNVSEIIAEYPSP